MSDNQKEDNGLIYLLCEENRTASVISCKISADEIIIPRSVTQKSIEYTIESISQGAFNDSDVKSIQFPPDSEVKKIEKNAFSYKIESLSHYHRVSMN